MQAAKLPGITFDVSPVELATKRLEEVPYRAAVERMVRGNIESCPLGVPYGLIRADCNGLVAAINLSFHLHRPLALSPDHVWLTICQGVATHVKQNSESLRKQFVNHEGREIIRVRRDDFVRGSPDNAWHEVWPEFVEKMRVYIGDTADKFLPNFSTTGIIERAACEITLMDAMQNYFDYRLETICGIPRVTLEGTSDDWAQLRERAKAFTEYDLAWWTEPLDKFLGKLHETSTGQVDGKWWKSFYKWEERSGGADVTGHVLDLFPYIFHEGDRTWRRNPRFIPLEEKLPKNPQYKATADLLRRDPEILNRVGSNEVPPGISKAPFIWEYYRNNFDYEFIGGFVGVRQMEDLALRPEIGWAVRPLTAKTEARIETEAPWESMETPGLVKSDSWWQRLVDILKAPR